jgi:hypothetical protein
MAQSAHIAFLLFLAACLGLVGLIVWPLLATVRGIGF